MNQSNRWKIVNDPTGDPLVVNFDKWKCNVLMERYAEGELSLRLVDVDDKSSICRATSNLTGQSPHRGEVFVKDYAENAGVLDALVGTGMFADSGREVDTGHGHLNILRLSDDMQEQWQKFDAQLSDVASRTR